MLHPFISTLIRRPNLLVDHLAGYAELIREEAAEAGTDLVQRVVAWVLVLVCAIVFLILAGIAVMLGAVMNQFHWALVAVPAVVLVLMVAAVLKARQPVLKTHFAEVKAQVDRDAQALRSAA
jgi:ABC-type antimicrobial peptide transport system permease subunit